MSHKLEQDSQSISQLKDEPSHLIKSYEISKHQEFDLKCGCIKPNHFVIAFSTNKDTECLSIHAIEPLLLNGKEITAEQGLQQLSNFDDLVFPCSVCATPHLYKFIEQVIPKKEVKQKPADQVSEGKPGASEAEGVTATQSTHETKLGVFSAEEEARVQPFIKDGLLTQQLQIMEAEKQKYIANLIDCKTNKKDGLHSLEAILENASFGLNCTSIIRKHPDY